MDEVFRRQFYGLFLKNWIVLSKHPFVSASANLLEQRVSKTPFLGV